MQPAVLLVGAHRPPTVASPVAKAGAAVLACLQSLLPGRPADGPPTVAGTGHAPRPRRAKSGVVPIRRNEAGSYAKEPSLSG